MFIVVFPKLFVVSSAIFSPATKTITFAPSISMVLESTTSSVSAAPGKIIVAIPQTIKPSISKLKIIAIGNEGIFWASIASTTL